MPRLDYVFGDILRGSCSRLRLKLAPDFIGWEKLWQVNKPHGTNLAILWWSWRLLRLTFIGLFQISLEWLSVWRTGLALFCCVLYFGDLLSVAVYQNRSEVTGLLSGFSAERYLLHRENIVVCTLQFSSFDWRCCNRSEVFRVGFGQLLFHCVHELLDQEACDRWACVNGAWTVGWNTIP